MRWRESAEIGHTSPYPPKHSTMRSSFSHVRNRWRPEDPAPRRVQESPWNLDEHASQPRNAPPRERGRHRAHEASHDVVREKLEEKERVVGVKVLTWDLADAPTRL